MTFGEVKRDGKSWLIVNVSPHVSIKLKRWFSRIDPKGERLLEVKADHDAMRRLAEDYLRRRGLDPSKPPAERELP